MCFHFFNKVFVFNFSYFTMSFLMSLLFFYYFTFYGEIALWLISCVMEMFAAFTVNVLRVENTRRAEKGTGWENDAYSHTLFTKWCGMRTVERHWGTRLIKKWKYVFWWYGNEKGYRVEGFGWKGYIRAWSLAWSSFSSVPGSVRGLEWSYRD